MSESIHEAVAEDTRSLAKDTMTNDRAVLSSALSAVVPVGEDEFAAMMAACGDGNKHPGAVAVAVSGGADSMALCLLVHRWAAPRGVSLTALTVDHGLRPGSACEAARVGTWLAKRAIAQTHLTWTDGASVTSRVQERARQARYDLMGTWCVRNGVKDLFLGHHMEDQAETVLMRLKHDSGLLGLAAMAPVRALDGVSGSATVHLTRPLLGTPKARLRATLRALGQNWIEDPSNRDPAFERVRIRHLLAHLEDLGVSARRLAGAAAGVGRVRAVLHLAADRVMSATVMTTGGLHVNAPNFFAEPKTVQQLALAKMLGEVSGANYAPAREKLRRLLGWMETAHVQGARARTLGGCAIRTVGGRGRMQSHWGFDIVKEAPRNNQKDAQMGDN